MFKTITEVRAAFWQGNEHLRAHYRAKKRQNEYNATIRCEFVEFVDMLEKDGHITEALARRVTL
jgi:hypothetical protein